MLDNLAGWGAADTPAGPFALVPVRPDRDLDRITGWMNDPAVAAFWELAGPPETTAAHLRGRLRRRRPQRALPGGAGRCPDELLGDLPRRPRPPRPPLRRPAPGHRSPSAHRRWRDRGRGLGSALLRATADLVLDHRPQCTRVIAEPDLRNTASVAAFLSAGFRYADEIELPEKRAALMVRDRARRHLL